MLVSQRRNQTLSPLRRAAKLRLLCPIQQRNFLAASGSPPPRSRCDTCWQKLFLARVHAFAHARHDDVARQKIRSSHRLQCNALSRQKKQPVGNVGIIFEAEVHGHLPAVIAGCIGFAPLVNTYPGDFMAFNIDEQILSMQYLIVVRIA